MNEQPSPTRTAKLRKLGFVPKGKSPGRTEVRSTGGPGARIASALTFGGMENTFGLPITGGLGLLRDVRHPVGAATHPLRVAQHLAEAGAPVDAPLARLLRMGGAAGRLEQYIHRGPEHTKGWRAERGPGGTPLFRDEEGNIVTSGEYPRSPSHIGQVNERTGGESYRARHARPQDYWNKVFDAYSKYKLGSRYIWGWPDMNIVGGKIHDLHVDPSGMHHFKVTLANGTTAHYKTTSFDERTLSDIEFGYIQPEGVWTKRGDYIPTPYAGEQPGLRPPPGYGTMSPEHRRAAYGAGPSKDDITSKY